MPDYRFIIIYDMSYEQNIAQQQIHCKSALKLCLYMGSCVNFGHAACVGVVCDISVY